MHNGIYKKLSGIAAKQDRALPYGCVWRVAAC